MTNPLVRRLRLSHLQPVVSHFFGPDFLDTLLALLGDCPPSPPLTGGPVTPTWWKKAVFYQIYPRSFADSNGDGIGDLRGIIEHLDHLEDLGVDCLWLSPVFASPNVDMGYDVSDYRDVITEMGTLEDLQELVDVCHTRGMRLILDLVVNHTSDQHPWFQATVADPKGPYGDFYFLREATSHTPPNNWTSFFSGPAWRRMGSTWALHLFAPEQPDLNWDNPAVRHEVADIVRFWVDKGIDGFRLDVINYVSKRERLPDGNPTIRQLMGFTGVEHYFHGPHLHDYLTELRREGFTRPDHGTRYEAPGKDAHPVMVGEGPGVGVEAARLLTNASRGELDLVFSFDHLETPGHVRWDDYAYDLNFLKHYWIDYQRRLGSDDWQTLFFENHDNPRMISKVNPDPAMRAPLGKALATLLLTMRGTPFIFQGQEIGRVNQDFPDARAARRRVVEPLGRRRLLCLGQDRGRVPRPRAHPMRRSPEAGLGFTSGTAWLDGYEDSRGFTMAEQRTDSDSVLSFHRALIALRHAHPALSLGRIVFVDEDVRDYFAYFREYEGERLFVEVNLSACALPRRHEDKPLEVLLGTAPDRSGPMHPYEAMVCRVLRG